LDSTPSQLTDYLRVVAQIGLGASIGFLVLTIGVVVFGVLRPGTRAVFGNNMITAGTALTSPQLDQVVFLELGQIYRALVNRNSKKAHWLNWAYLTFFVAVLIAAGTAVYVL